MIVVKREGGYKNTFVHDQGQGPDWFLNTDDLLPSGLSQRPSLNLYGDMNIFRIV